MKLIHEKSPQHDLSNNPQDPPGPEHSDETVSIGPKI